MNGLDYSGRWWWSAKALMQHDNLWESYRSFHFLWCSPPPGEDLGNKRTYLSRKPVLPVLIRTHSLRYLDIHLRIASPGHGEALVDDCGSHATGARVLTPWYGFSGVACLRGWISISTLTHLIFRMRLLGSDHTHVVPLCCAIRDVQANSVSLRVWTGRPVGRNHDKLLSALPSDAPHFWSIGSFPTMPPSPVLVRFNV